MILRAFSTAASKNSRVRFLGSGPYQMVGWKDPAMSTQQRAPIASARASPSVTVRRLAARLAGSASSRFTHRPTSEMTTSWRAKARSMSRILGSSFRSTAGQYAAR